MQIKKAAVLGAGVMGAQIAAHLANAGIPCLLLDIAPKELTPEEQKAGLTLESPRRPQPHRAGRTRRREEGQAGRLLFARNRRPGLGRQFRGRPAEVERLRLGDRGDRREPRNQALALRAHRAASGRRGDRHARTLRAFRSAASPKGVPTTSAGGFSARTSSIRRAICICSKSSARRKPTPRSRFHRRFLRPGSRQGHRSRERHAQFHRQPHRQFRHARRHRGHARRRLHDRRGRRDDRHRHRPRQERDRSARSTSSGWTRPFTSRRTSTPALPNDEKRETFTLPDVLQKMVERKLLGDKTKGGFFRKVGDEIQTLDLATLRIPPSDRSPNSPRSKRPRTSRSSKSG